MPEFTEVPETEQSFPISLSSPAKSEMSSTFWFSQLLILSLSLSIFFLWSVFGVLPQYTKTHETLFRSVLNVANPSMLQTIEFEADKYSIFEVSSQKSSQIHWKLPKLSPAEETRWHSTENLRFSITNTYPIFPGSSVYLGTVADERVVYMKMTVNDVHLRVGYTYLAFAKVVMNLLAPAGIAGCMMFLFLQLLQQRLLRSTKNTFYYIELLQQALLGNRAQSLPVEPLEDCQLIHVCVRYTRKQLNDLARR